jgi:arsenate reductase-like glutaredoxin family protein
MDEQSAVQTMLAQPTLIKRPVLVTQENVMVGFSEKNYSENL